MGLSLDKSTWKRVAFGDVIENIAVRVDDPSAAGVDRYVGLEHLNPGVMTIQRWDSPDKVEAQKLRFQPGDVIFGRRRAYQKKVARADFEGICSAHALVLRARPDVMRPDFLPVFLSSDHFLDCAIAISVGSLSPTVNWRDLRIQEFLLPTDLDEQQRIADLLWSIERHREAHVRQDGAAASAVGRMLDAVLVREGELRVLAEAVDAIVDCAHKTAPTDHQDFARVIGTPDVRHGRLLLETARPVSRETYESWTERAVPQVGDLIFTREAPAGEVGIVTQGMRVCLGQRTVLIRPKQLSDAHLLWAILRSNFIQDRIRTKANGSTVPHLNVADIRDLEVPWPATRESMGQVSAIVEETQRAAEIAAQEGAALLAARSSVMAQVFGGTE